MAAGARRRVAARRRVHRLTGIALAVLAAGAGGGAACGSERAIDRGGGTPSYAAADEGCPDIFGQDAVRQYEIEVAPEIWAALMAELLAGPPREDAAERYHPLAAFRLGAEVRTDARIRLKGRSSWAHTVAEDADPKAQFVVAFGRDGDGATFHGVRKISFDMPRSDRTMLAERLAYAFMRVAGLPAPCASSAELIIDHQPYGLYVSKETYGGRLLERLFPGAADGVLLDRGTAVTENAAAYDAGRAAALWAARDVAGMLAAGVDLDDSLRVWAAEAIVNAGDGYWGGNHNFLLYDDPRRGWRWLSDDVDAAFAWIPRMQHPLYWWVDRTWSPATPPQHYLAVIGAPPWRGRFVAAIADVLDRYDADTLQVWLDAWAAQVAAALARDPRRPFTAGEHRAAVAATRAELAERAAYLRAFLACAAGTAAAGDRDDDRDGDGQPWCLDCDDAHPDVRPGAVDTCGDGVDQDCDGVADQGCPH
jgi:hypothetical protein